MLRCCKEQFDLQLPTVICAHRPLQECDVQAGGGAADGGRREGEAPGGSDCLGGTSLPAARSREGKGTAQTFALGTNANAAGMLLLLARCPVPV